MSEFKKSLKNLKNNLETSETQKIHTFYRLCEKCNIEPIVLRLSGDIKNRFIRSRYLITFTTTRIIISKKSNLRNLIDIGYVAGLGPYLYYLVSDKVKLEDIKLKDSYIQKMFFDSSSKNKFYIEYIDINKLILRNGIETLTTNMLGSLVIDNFLKIYTQKKNSYEFIISAKKNGDYEKIFYWLKMSLPITVHEE
ncbi:MAG: hypothetical protein M3Z01_03145 [Thermoproteota archaeon]|nr:hypothetical protein [Thermoproteota archaeon]